MQDFPCRSRALLLPRNSQILYNLQGRDSGLGPYPVLGFRRGASGLASDLGSISAEKEKMKDSHRSCGGSDVLGKSYGWLAKSFPHQAAP